VNTPASAINRAYVASLGAAAPPATTGKEMTTAAVKAAHGVRAHTLVSAARSPMLSYSLTMRSCDCVCMCVCCV
jgi:hypothetical protein